MNNDAHNHKTNHRFPDQQLRKPECENMRKGDLMTKKIIKSSDQHVDSSGNDDETRLSNTQLRALEIFIKPTAGQKTLKAIADELGISTRMLHKIRKDLNFQNELKAAIRRMITQNLSAVVQATITSALIIGKEGHHDRKLILNLAELIDPTGKKKDEDPPSKTKDVNLTVRFEQAEARRALMLAQVDVEIGDDMDTADASVVEAEWEEMEDLESSAV